MDAAIQKQSAAKKEGEPVGGRKRASLRILSRDILIEISSFVFPRKRNGLEKEREHLLFAHKFLRTRIESREYSSVTADSFSLFLRIFLRTLRKICNVDLFSTYLLHFKLLMQIFLTKNISGNLSK